MKQPNMPRKPIELIPISNIKHKGIIAGVIAMLLIILLVLYYNTSNEKVDGGYVAYVRTNPIVGVPEFRQVIKGPGGTGLVWRQNSVIICVTPYTTEEKFDDIRAADHLKMKADAHLVWRIDANKVREFVEQYGAVTEVEPTPEAIAQDAYASFIRQPFCSAVRTSIARFRGLDAPGHIPEITDMVEKELRAALKDTPFIVESVTIGSTVPPESVTAGITKKVEATQEYERQAIQLEIAKRNEEIADAEGRAKANRMNQEAQGALLKAKAEADAELYRRQQEAAAVLAMKRAEAEGMRLEAEGRKALNDAIGENLIRWQTVQNLDKIRFPHINVGSEAITPLLDAIKAVQNQQVTPAP